MAIEQVKTFGDIIDSIVDRAKLNTDTATRTRVKEYVNTSYQKIVYQRPYKWSGETGRLTFDARYNTGTATFTNGSGTLTGASTVWTTDHEGWKIYRVGDNVIYNVLRRDSATSLQIHPVYAGTTTSAASYVLYKDEYGLFPDLQDLRFISIPNRKHNLIEIGPRDMEGRRSEFVIRHGVPEYFTTHGLNYFHSTTWANFAINTDYWEDDPDATRPKNKNLILWPSIFTSSIVAKIRYTQKALLMNDDAEEPIIPPENRYILVLDVLVENFMIERDFVTKREWESRLKEYQRRMEADVETTDDSLILTPDRTRDEVRRRFGLNEEEFYVDPD